jgi:hypothetical protein
MRGTRGNGLLVLHDVSMPPLGKSVSDKILPARKNSQCAHSLFLDPKLGRATGGSDISAAVYRAKQMERTKGGDASIHIGCGLILGCE